MNNSISILHTEWSDGWGGQEIRIITEMVAIRNQGMNVFLACRDHSIIKNKAKEKNIEVFTLGFKGNADIKTLFNLIKIINANNINIVNTHSGKDTWVGGIAAKFTKAKFIRTRHLSTPIKTSRLNFINEVADFIITTGETVKSNMIRDNRIIPNKIRSIPTGIDTHIFNPNRYDKKNCLDYFKLTDNQILIGTMGVLRIFKRHDRFLLMARYVINQNPNKKIHFLLAGDGPLSDNLHHRIKEMGLSSQITMLGHVNNVARFLKILDIFVLTSDSGEGVPQSLAQALFMQTAVVSTNAGSSKDLYNNNNFLLINKDSQVEINEACNQLVNNVDLCNMYAHNSRKFALENFSINKMTKKILKIYSDLNENENENKN